MNSAQRLEGLFVTLRSVTPPTSLPNNPPSGVDAWAALFGRHGLAGQDLDDAAAECAIYMNQEVTHLGRLLADLNVPEDLYARHLSQLRSVTSTRYHHTHWAELIKMVRDEQIVMLQWAGFLLGNDGSEDIAAEVEKLSTEINALISEVEESNLPSPLRKFVLRNLRSILDALWRYKVSGTAPLQAAMQAINGTSEQELASLQPITSQLHESDRGILQRVGAALTSVANACDVATKIHGGYALGATAMGALGLIAKVMG